MSCLKVNDENNVDAVEFPFDLSLHFPHLEKKMLLKQHRMEAGDTAVEASAAGHTD